MEEMEEILNGRAKHNIIQMFQIIRGLMAYFNVTA